MHDTVPDGLNRCAFRLGPKPTEQLRGSTAVIGATNRAGNRRFPVGISRSEAGPFQADPVNLAPKQEVRATLRRISRKSDAG
jgi:hypothetical protein